LAAVLRDADTASAPCALQVYESLRRERCARVQRSSRVNGARYDASGSDLAERDRQLSAQPQERGWIWNYDAEVEAMRAVA
jgi:salicylate hydroxylase